MAIMDKRVALVTGSGAGIGRGIGLQLAADGYHVFLNSRSADPSVTDKGAYEGLARITEAGGSGDVIRADVSSAEDRGRMIETIAEKCGRLDLLVNNAGVAPNVRADILEAGEESFDRLININVKGPYFLTQLAAQRMIEWKRAGVIPTGRIVFVTSISAFTSSVNRGDYCISKAALSMASALFADRLGEYDIPVVELRPGVIATDMTAGVKEKYDALIADGIFPQKRWGQPEDIARAVSAVGRGDFDYSTGTAIDISGGFNLHRL